jgi:hypothetical protein
MHRITRTLLPLVWIWLCGCTGGVYTRYMRVYDGPIRRPNEVAVVILAESTGGQLSAEADLLSIDGRAAPDPYYRSLGIDDCHRHTLLEMTGGEHAIVIRFHKTEINSLQHTRTYYSQTQHLRFHAEANARYALLPWFESGRFVGTYTTLDSLPGTGEEIWTLARSKNTALVKYSEHDVSVVGGYAGNGWRVPGQVVYGAIPEPYSIFYNWEPTNYPGWRFQLRSSTDP